jgi:hypothetical protein
MTIYKVVDKQKHDLYAFAHLDTSQKKVEVLTGDRDDHYCFLEAVEIRQS